MCLMCLFMLPDVLGGCLGVVWLFGRLVLVGC